MNRILGVLGPLRSRLLPSQPVLHTRYSLSSRIQALLPDLGESPFEEPSKDLNGQATGEPSPAESIPDLLSKSKYLQASKSFTSSTSIGTFEADFERLVSPHIASPFSLGEMLYCISQLGLGALINNEPVKSDFDLVATLETLAFDAANWDTMITASCGIHFPQILWSKDSSLWIKTRIMHLIILRADPKYAETTLRRYIGQLKGYEPVRYLAPADFALVAKVVLDGQDPNHIVALLRSSTRKTFQSTWRRIKSKQLQEPEILHAALEQAIELRMTYEVTNICKYGQGNFSLSLLKRALLAVAWGQKHQPDRDDASFTTAQHVKTQNVVGVLKSIPATTIDRVLYRAVGDLPPNILWALILGWEESGLGVQPRPVFFKLAHLMIERPHLEQLRYMALPSTPDTAISQLLKLNVQKVNRIRDETGVKQETMIEDIDMKLFIGGMVLLSEKTAGTSEKAAGSTRAFGSLVDEMFMHWSPEQAQKTIDSLYEYHSPSPQVTLTMVAMLLRHKSYTQAVQLLHTNSAADLPPAIFHQLLLQVCTDFPQITTVLTTWLTSVLRVYLPPTLLQRMVVLLSKQRELSDRQSMLRINSVLKLLRGQKASLGPDAAAAIVDGLLDRALTRPGGSRNRLQWALDLCKEEGVPQEKVKEWVEVINSMRRDGKGYWHKRR